eukprot:SAG22_NODE_11851_length_466_cov_1.272480_1_plen_104_part_10
MQLGPGERALDRLHASRRPALIARLNAIAALCCVAQLHCTGRSSVNSFEHTQFHSVLLYLPPKTFPMSQSSNNDMSAGFGFRPALPAGHGRGGLPLLADGRLER